MVQAVVNIDTVQVASSSDTVQAVVSQRYGTGRSK